MDQTIKAFIICMCITAIFAAPTGTSNGTEKRTKRQAPLAYAGGLGLGYGSYDYNDYYGDYTSDYNYDYYDWVCDETNCQLCDILTSECCNPNIDINCFLPDSCLNNPCLGGGTCITTKTVDLRPDFVCVCLPGLTGKYCQLTNDYFIGGSVVGPIIQPAPLVAPFGGPPPAYGGQIPMPAYGGQAPVYGGQAPLQGPVYGGQAPLQGPIYGDQAPLPAQAQPTIYGQAQVQGPVSGQQYGQDQQFAAHQPDQFQQQQPQPQFAAQPSYAQDIAPNGGAPMGGQIRPMAAKRMKCAVGQVFNYERKACMDFTLKRKVSK